MSIFRPVVNDQKKYSNNNSSNSHDFYNQGQFDSTANESQVGFENITSSSAYPAIIQSPAGPDSTTDVSYAFENSFPHDWSKMLVSKSPKQQLNTSSKYANNTKNSVPFWDSWLSNDETDTIESRQLQAPLLVEDQKPRNCANPKVGSMDIIAQKLASGSTQLGTKRKNNAITTDERYKRPRFETPSSLPSFKVRVYMFSSFDG